MISWKIISQHVKFQLNESNGMRLFLRTQKTSARLRVCEANAASRNGQQAKRVPYKTDFLCAFSKKHEMSFHRQDNDTSLEYNQDFLPIDLADDLYLALDKLDWNTKMLNRRSNITLGDKGLVYKVEFRDNTMIRTTRPWSTVPLVQRVKELLEEQLGLTFNYCAVMRYPHGNIVIKKHCDKEMVAGTTIAGVSLGATRTIRFTRRYTDVTGIDIDLLHGSLYVMHPPTNDKWFHEIMADGKDIGCRYSLTFRNIPREIAENY